MPENYPGIIFDSDGVCNHCTSQGSVKSLGMDALKTNIISSLEKIPDRNKDYDCILRLSGGRDSTYLLYLLSEKLNLRVLAYSADNGFLSGENKTNLERTTKKLGAELVVEKHQYMKKCVRHHIKAWMKRPEPAMIGLLCTGCRLGMDIGALKLAEKCNVPIVISGGTPFEGRDYKIDLLRSNLEGDLNHTIIRGYLSQAIKNPRWVLNPTSLVTQIKEYYYHYYRQVMYGSQDGIKMFSPYHGYIHWKEDDISSTLDKLGWKKNPSLKTTWRGDCDVALLKSYLYKKTLGFNNMDDHLSDLVRDRQITRKNALERLKVEGSVPVEVIEKIITKFGFDFVELEAALRKWERMSKSHVE